MKEPSTVWKDAYLAGSVQLPHRCDCCVYLLDLGDLVLIDSGTEEAFNRLVANIQRLRFDPKRLKFKGHLQVPDPQHHSLSGALNVVDFIHHVSASIIDYHRD